jgi:hypothetical protein
MRLLSLRSVLVMSLICLAAGCSSNLKGRIEGTTWTSLPGLVKGRSLPANFMRLEFAKDGTMSYKVGPRTMTGRYNLNLSDYLTLDLDEEVSGKKSHVEEVVITGETLTMKDLDGTQLTFSKVR